MKNKMKTSIFIKLIMIIIFSTILTHLVVFSFSFLIIRTTYITFINHYRYFYYYSLKSLTETISKNPDIEELKKIFDKMKIQIRYENKNMSIATSNEVPFIKNLFIQSQQYDKELKIGKYKKSFFLIIERQNDSFVFLFPNTPVEIKPYYVILIILATNLIFLAAYFLIRNILQPMKYLMKGVKEVQQSNFDYQVPVKTRDQFSTLINSFNSMTRLIKQTMYAKDQLILDVSHELRSPMMRMKVALEFVKDKEIQKSLKTDLNEMGTMITEILEVERLKSEFGRIKLRNTDIIKLLKEIKNNYKNKSQKIILSNLPENKFLFIDEDRIKIVFKNIFENAIHYSKDNKKSIIVTFKEDANFLFVDIQDSGIGISGKYLPYIFEPFYRADNSRSKKTGGYGLGMYLCKKIMEAHSGDITIASKVDRGTTVFLKFKK